MGDRGTATALEYISLIFQKYPHLVQDLPNIEVPQDVVFFCSERGEEASHSDQKKLLQFAVQTLSNITTTLREAGTKPILRAPKTVPISDDDEEDEVGVDTKTALYAQQFEIINSKDDPKVSHLRIKQDSGLKHEGVFLVESKWPSQRIILLNKYRIRYIMITVKHAKWLLSFIKQNNLLLANTQSGSDSNGNSGGDKQALKVYLVKEEVMEEILGYVLHRGCMTVAERITLPSLPELLATILSANEDKPVLVVVGEHIASPDNIGAMFRSALALGASAVFITPTSADPLYRKSIRSSMGATTKLPYAWMANFPSDLNVLKSLGFSILALTLTDDAVPLSRIQYTQNKRVALMVGHEGDGLTKEAISSADHCVKIEMSPHAVDSLNVAACTSVALYTMAQAIGVLKQ